MTSPTTTVRRWARNVLLVGTAGAAGLTLAAQRPAEAFPFPDPTYDIIAVSDGHQASLLNLELGQPGAPEAPVPVDVDGDLLPDVTVAVNLVDPIGAVDNPPDVPGFLVPNIEINRILTGPLLGQPVPPLRIEVQLRLIDAFGDGPDTLLRFGYDTGPGGSIPPAFKARLGGIENFFNPLVATVDTGPSEGRPVTYDGPLRLVGRFDSGDTHVDLGLGFSPFPKRLEVTYATDDAGQHITYTHEETREVDARAVLDMETADSETHVDARIDRLPRAIEVDIAEGGSDSGAIRWRSSSDGRRPDLDAHVTSVSDDPESEPLYADIDLDSLPPELGASWSLPEDGPIDVDLDTGGDPDQPGTGHGIGGVDIDIRNHAADHPQAVARFVPDERQYVSVRQEAGAGGEVLRRISGRVERVRSASFSDADGTLTATVSMGDGESPFQVDYDCRADCSEDGSTRLTDVAATVSPLPADFSVSITDAGTDPRVAPMLIDYTASTPVDVEASIGIAQAGSTGDTIDCGTARTVCADVMVRDLPGELHARLGQYTSPHDPDEVPDEADLRLEVDLVDAVIQPDLTASVVLGPDEPGDRPLVADAEVLALPDHLRVYLHQHKETVDGTDTLALDRAAFHACDRDVDAEACVPETEGEIGALTLSLRTFLERPVGFPVPLHDRPQYATVVGRPAPDGQRNLEVGARVEHVSDLEYLDTGTIQGVFTAAGDGETPFTARIDLRAVPGDDVDMDEQGTLTGVTRDLRAEAEVTDLPPSFGVCFRTPNEDMVAADAPFTAACEESELPGDPLAFAYALDVDEDDLVAVDGTFRTTTRGTLDGETYSETLDAEASVPDVPSWVTVQASIPEEDTVGPIDAIYEAENTLDIDFAARMTVGDARCLDPRPDAEAMCVEAYLAQIPEQARVHYDPTDDSDNLAIDTDGGTGLSLQDLRLTSVSPRPEPIEEPFPTPAALVVTGFIEDLPEHVRGTVVLPADDGNPATPELGTTMIVCASSQPCDTDGATEGRIGRIKLDVGNVVVADPTPLGGVGVLPGPRDTGLGEITDEILLVQRGSIFRATLDIEGVGGVGYRQVTDGEGRKLETNEFLLRFGTGEAPVIRAYADLDGGTERTIADVVLGGVPASTRFCFRGAPNEGTPANPTWCDENNTDAGAIQFLATPGADTTGLDVDGFVRHTTGGDAQGISARVRVTDIPPVLEGAIPSGEDTSMDVAGFDLAHEAQGIGSIRFEAASFDIDDHGFVGDLPWSREVGPINDEDFPAPALAGHHMSVVVTDEEFHARGRLDGLQRIELRDGLCDGVPASVEDGNPARYPAYPGPVDGGGPYTCARVNVDGGSVGQPFNIRAFMRTGDEIMHLDEAGIAALPSSFRFTMAEAEPLNPDGTLRDACPAQPAPVPVGGCMAPLVRVDIDGAGADLFGHLRLGREDHLEELALVDPQDESISGALSYADLDSIPAQGARVRIGTWGDEPGYEDVEPGTAVIARLRVPIPGSFQLDPPQTWSDADDVDDPTWEATDLRMHYVARDGAGAVIPSLGDLKLLVHNAPVQKQILLTGGTPGLGVPIPGEMAVGVYLRDDKEAKRMFVQADGHVSTDMSLAVSIFPGLPPVLPISILQPPRPPDLIQLEVLNIPGSDTDFESWYEPGFRLQAEIIDDGDPPEPCSATSCSRSSSRLDEVHAMLDFHPEGSSTEAARLIQAVVHTLPDGGPLGVQVAGYQDVLGGGVDGNVFDGDAEISLFGNLRLDPLTSYEFSGVPWLANWSVTLDTTLELGISVERAKTFQLFNDTLGVVANYDTGSDGRAQLGPIAMRPDYIFAGVEFLGVTLFGFELPPYNSGEVLPLDFPSCDGGAIAAEIILGDVLGGSAVQQFFETLPWVDPYDGSGDYGYGVELEPNSRNDILIFPEINLPLDPGPGLTALGAGVLADLLPGVAHGIGCKVFDLDTVDLLGSQHPGVPDIDEVSDHVVPGEPEPTVHTPPVMTPPDPTGAVAIGNGDGEGDADDDAMCGHQVFQGHVDVMGTLEVATTAGPRCPAGQEGRLDLVGHSITVQGAIEADDVVDASCGGEPWGSYNHAADGASLPMDAQSIFTFGDAQAACDDYMASGTGAAHGGFGGPAGTGNGAYTYDGRVEAGAATAGYGGGDGSTSNGGGRGGGFVRLVAEDIAVNGTISADGEAGDSASSACDALSLGSGGGSGGGIALLANRVRFGPATLSVDGGDGGNGSLTGGGGGAPGDIEVAAGLITGSFTAEEAAGGGGSANDGCDVFAHGSSAIPVSIGHVEATQRSFALPPTDWDGDDIWFTTNDVDKDGDGAVSTEEESIHIPFAASANSANGMTVALCGVVLHPSIANYEEGFKALTPEYVSPSDPCGLADLGDLGLGIRIDTARLIDHVYLPDTNHISAFDGFDLDISTLTEEQGWCPTFLGDDVLAQVGLCNQVEISAYYGLYTVVLRSDVPNNDCLDPTDTGSFFLDDIVGCWKFVPGPTSAADNDCHDPFDYLEPSGSFFYAGAEYDSKRCIWPNVEVPPGDAGPDIVIGIDNDAPDTATITPTLYDPLQDDGTDVWTRRHYLAGSIAATDTLPGTSFENTSGVAGYVCREVTPGQEPRTVNCDADGTFETWLTPGDGRKNLEFVVYDAVGNSTVFPFDRMVVDTVIPTSVLTVDPAEPDQPNGWYSGEPDVPLTLTLSGFEDPAPDSLEAPPHPHGRYRFQIDDGTELSCDGNDAQPGPVVCELPVTPGPGTHEVWYTAYDRAGNRGRRGLLAALLGRGMAHETFRIDDASPIAGVLVSPQVADGANGWWTTVPYIGVQANDLPVGGAGVDPDVSPSALDVEVDGPGYTGTMQPYGGPFLLGVGSYDICATARDVADNPDPGDPPVLACVLDIHVDPFAPQLDLDVAGTLGSDGWYTDSATVTPNASDLLSGIDPGTAPSGVFLSVDDGPYVLTTGSVFVGEGVHVVRAYAVDVAGNQSRVEEVVVRVDRSRPTSELRTIAADPALGPWFRTRPTVVLRATDGDHNAGVTSIRYCIGSAGCVPDTTYTGPFEAPEGTSTIRWQALDGSGSANHEPLRSAVLRADTGVPTPVATSASKLLWIRLLGPSSIQLRYTVSDALPGPLTPVVVIYDVLGNPVRRITGPTIDVAAGQTVQGSVPWDGKVNPLGNLVPVGVYHYRVLLTDQAGNIAISGESRPITIKLL